MANSEQIQYYINMINTAVRGEDVRTAIVELLKLANSSGTNAYTLNGLSADKFAKQSDMDQILPLATEPTQNGTRPVSSGGLYTYLQELVTAINIILRDNSAGTVSSKIQNIASIRYDLMTALNEKGQTTHTTDKFDTFAGKIRNIQVETNFETETLSVSENGDYVPDEGHAYTTVSVDVQPTLKTKTITSLGTFKASDDDAYGFSEVTVSLSSGGSGGGDQSLNIITKDISSSDLPDEARAATFKASDDEALGYSEVTVDVTGKLGTLDEDIDPINSQYTFLASDDGLYGYDKVVINIVESQGPFTVEFWDGSTRLQIVNDIYRGQTAVCTNIPTPAEGKMFVGWSPDPVNVISNLKCYAQWDDATIYPPGSEVQETWDQIGKNGGVNIQPGAYKTLYHDAFDYNGTHYSAGSFKMYKIYEGENGSTSTWVSEGLSTVNFMPSATLYNNERHYGSSFTFYGWTDGNGNGNDCDLAKFLNNDLLNAISNINDLAHGYSGSIVNYMKSVTKYTNIYDANGDKLSNAISNHKIWIPSNREWSNGASMYQAEDQGPSYNPNSIWGGGTASPLTRTAVSWQKMT